MMQSYQKQRWTNVFAALAIHMSIGQVYAFSVFNKPLSQLLGLDHSAPGDWSLVRLGWIFSLAILFLGLGAAFGGRWLEKYAPKQAITFAACCFGGGLALAALGVHLHHLNLLYLGYGVLGGIGMGIAYVIPVAVLIRWFPNRRGFATGLAIMGFGGGAILNAPFSVALMHYFSTSTSLGVDKTFLALAIIYSLIMLLAARFLYLPKNIVATTEAVLNDMTAKQAIRKREFYLIWGMMCLNISAGIGLLSQASLMIQEIFKGRVSALQAAGFVSLLGLSNMCGRLIWSSSSDYLGRKITYFIFFGLGAALYLLIPYWSETDRLFLFILSCALIMSMYGGAFATLPAYLTDVFGVTYVSRIHGYILTAWALAGTIGPLLLNSLRAHEIHHAVAKAQAYDLVLNWMAVLLIIALLLNYFVRVSLLRKRL